MLKRRHYVLAERKAKKKEKPGRSPIKGHGYIYRVGWQRRTRENLTPEGPWDDGRPRLLRPKYKHFHTYDAALKFFRLFGPAPWRYFRSPLDPDERWPCFKGCGGSGKAEGYVFNDATGKSEKGIVACGQCFGGVTVRDYIRLRRLELPEIVWIRLERRPVGAWEDTGEQWDDEAAIQDGEPTRPRGSSATRFLQEAFEEEATRYQEVKASEALMLRELEKPF